MGLPSVQTLKIYLLSPVSRIGTTLADPEKGLGLPPGTQVSEKGLMRGINRQ